MASSSVAGRASGPRHVHRPELLFDGQGPADLVEGIPGAQGLGEPVPLVLTQPLPAPGEEAADAIERVDLASPVPGGLSLDPAADVIDTGVGQLHGVEDVDRDGGLRQRGGQGLEVPGVGIDGGDGHLLTEVPGASGKPAGHRGCAATRDDVQELVPVEVDQLGGEDGPVPWSGRQHLVLVDAEGPDTADPTRIIDQRPSVVPDGAPWHSPSPRRRCSPPRRRCGPLGRPAGRLLGGPGAEGARLDQPARLGEGLRSAVGVGTAPAALAPDQTHRAPRDRQIPHLDRRCGHADGPHPAAWTPSRSSLRLDQEPQLVARSWSCERTDEALHAQQRGRAATTVTHAPCPPFSLGLETARIGGHEALLGGCLWAGHLRSPTHAWTSKSHQSPNLGDGACRCQ